MLTVIVGLLPAIVLARYHFHVRREDDTVELAQIIKTLWDQRIAVVAGHAFFSMKAAIASVSRPNISAAESVYPSRR